MAIISGSATNGNDQIKADQAKDYNTGNDLIGVVHDVNLIGANVFTYVQFQGTSG